MLGRELFTSRLQIRGSDDVVPAIHALCPMPRNLHRRVPQMPARSMLRTHCALFRSGTLIRAEWTNSIGRGHKRAYHP